jgi:malonate decarboxylase gamma subunit
VGLLEGWQIAKAVYEVIEKDKNSKEKTPIIAIIDVASQAYGRSEESYGIHQALAGAAGSYATARQKGHPVIGLIVGKAMSGAFLAHGYQANCLIAFNDKQVMVHAMGKEAAARITLRSITELEKLAETVPPMAYDIKNYNKLGILWKLLDIDDASHPSSNDIKMVESTLIQALSHIRESGDITLRSRILSPLRKASLAVREMIEKNWN